MDFSAPQLLSFSTFQLSALDSQLSCLADPHQRTGLAAGQGADAGAVAEDAEVGAGEVVFKRILAVPFLECGGDLSGPVAIKCRKAGHPVLARDAGHMDVHGYDELVLEITDP